MRSTRAREIGFYSMADELLEIADDSRNDWIDRETKDGRIERVLDKEALERSRLRIEARKWTLARQLPKVFGDRGVLEHTGKDSAPIKVEYSDFELARRVIFLLTCAEEEQKEKQRQAAASAASAQTVY